MQRHEISPGQYVWINTARKRGRPARILGKVLRINPKNIKVIDEEGTKWTAHPNFLSAATAAEGAAWTDKTSTPATTASSGPLTHLTLGQVVRFPTGHPRGRDLYVVLGSHSGAYRLAKLGGDGDRYIRGVVPSTVEVVEFDLAGV